MSPFIASAIQAAPAFFEKEKTLQKIGDLTYDASVANSKLMLFPEVFIPGYPRGAEKDKVSPHSRLP